VSVPRPQGERSTYEAREEHEHEEECLFFVAISRARHVLRLYRSRRNAWGEERPWSKFLGWIGVREIDAAPRAPAPRMLALRVDAADDERPDLAWPEGQPISDAQIELYERCPRRLLYADVLGLGGTARTTPFARTHKSVARFAEWYFASTERPGPQPAREELAGAFEKHGPASHPLAEEYRALATRLGEALEKVAGTGERLPRRLLGVRVGGGTVAVAPDEGARKEDDAVVVRRLRTWVASKEGKKARTARLADVALQMAAHAAFGGGVRVEVAHLTDREVVAVDVRGEELEEGTARIEGAVRDIGRGRFPATGDRKRCARCPHLFGGGPVPKKR
jgi:hypothetical protein